ncbi:hypothetical protein DQ04_09941010 [Trypanosoma grayi]|uniref:hypothetical protein n=1 Tax=Trypanosoma grayi TaxID=71804 RepID=UPI0004F42E3C|nr:hypothetical protein DQ04_09941010 [Trypanosoma grayi]KEG07392.1 hypothetical protein DQ04_09941010 [Trypanosoma grayi]
MLPAAGVYESRSDLIPRAATAYQHPSWECDATEFASEAVASRKGASGGRKHAFPRIPSPYSPSISPQLTESGGCSVTPPLSAVSSPSKQQCHAGTRSECTPVGDTASIATFSRHNRGEECWSVRSLEFPESRERKNQMPATRRSVPFFEGPVALVAVPDRRSERGYTASNTEENTTRKSCTTVATVIDVTGLGPCRQNVRGQSNPLTQQTETTQFNLHRKQRSQSLSGAPQSRLQRNCFMEPVQDEGVGERSRRQQWPDLQSYNNARHQAHKIALLTILERYDEQLTRVEGN